MFRLKVAFRYAFSKIRRQRLTSIFICLGIAAGIFAMFLIMSIMNGLQSKQIETLRSVESFDIIIWNSDLTTEQIEEIKGVDRAFEFAETPVLVNNLSSSSSVSARIRAYDPSFFDYKRVRGNFTSYPIPDTGISLSYNIASSLKFLGGSNFEITFLRPGKTATIVPYTQSIEVKAYYSSALTEFNDSTVLTSLDTYRSILGERNIGTGVFCSSSVEKIAQAIKDMDGNAEVITWKQYNNAVYGALVLEKSIMYVFLSFMFLIICVNLRNSTRRLIDSRQVEGAMFRALGYRRKDIRIIFVLQGLIICLIGEAAGTLFGLLALNNMESIMDFIGRVSGSYLFVSSMIEPSLSSIEITVILCAVLLLGFIYTYAGCRKVFRSEIMEVIYDVSD